MNGENDQISSCSGANRRNCPAMIPANTFNGRLAHSPCKRRGQRHQRSAKPSRQAPADHAQQQCRFQRKVAGKEALGAESYPDAEGDGDRHPQRQIDLVPGFALLAKDRSLEFFGAHQGARHGRSHAQLDQEVDEYQPRFQHRIDLAPLGRPTLAQRFSAGKNEPKVSSPGGTAEFAVTLSHGNHQIRLRLYPLPRAKAAQR